MILHNIGEPRVPQSNRHKNTLPQRHFRDFRKSYFHMNNWMFIIIWFHLEGLCFWLGRQRSHFVSWLVDLFGGTDDRIIKTTWLRGNFITTHLKHFCRCSRQGNVRPLLTLICVSLQAEGQNGNKATCNCWFLPWEFQKIKEVLSN